MIFNNAQEKCIKYFNSRYNTLLLISFFILIGAAAFAQFMWGAQHKMYSSVIYYVIGLITVMSFFIVNYQFRLQATFSKLPLSRLSSHIREFQVEIIRLLEGKSIGICKAEIEKEGNEKIFQAVLFFLGAYDDIAVGVVEGILDERLVRKLQGNFMIKLYNSLMPYLKELSKGKPAAGYPGFEALMIKWGQPSLHE